MKDQGILKYLRYFFERICVFGISYVLGCIYFKWLTFFWGLECGRGIKVWGTMHVLRGSGTKIKIGNKVSLNSSSFRTTAASLYSRIRLRTFRAGAEIIIGDGVGLNGTSITARSKVIIIGNGTIIAPNVIIVDSDFHALWPPENRAYNPGFETDENVNIGENVWVGMNSLILKGVTIGNNSVIGAGSVVSSDIPADCIACGNPAKMIRQLP